MWGDIPGSGRGVPEVYDPGVGVPMSGKGSLGSMILRVAVVLESGWGSLGSVMGGGVPGSGRGSLGSMIREWGSPGLGRDPWGL